MFNQNHIYFATVRTRKLWNKRITSQSIWFCEIPLHLFCIIITELRANKFNCAQVKSTWVDNNKYIAYSLHTYWNQFFLGGVSTQEKMHWCSCRIRGRKYTIFLFKICLFLECDLEPRKAKKAKMTATKVIRLGKLISVAYSLCTYWSQFSLGGVCKPD